MRTVLLTLALMGLLRMRTPEVLRRRCPVDLGRLLGLDRAPEVKTLRRKLAALAGQPRSEALMQRLARRRAEAEAAAMGYLYVDGHVRAYHGKRRLPKTHVARIRLSMPASVDHWVNDRDGDPLFVVTATETSSLAHELPEVLRQARAAVGDDRRVTVVFDRGGWPPRLFLKMADDGFDVVTYRKGKILPAPAEALLALRAPPDRGPQPGGQRAGAQGGLGRTRRAAMGDAGAHGQPKPDPRSGQAMRPAQRHRGPVPGYGVGHALRHPGAGSVTVRA